MAKLTVSPKSVEEKEQEVWRTEADVRSMKEYQEIIKDPGRLARAKKWAAEEAATFKEVSNTGK
jgi:hypothetical protein